MHVLVLGGYGFIGEAVVCALLAAGHDVTGLGRDIDRARARLPQAKWVRADLAQLRRAADWDGLLGGVDAVVNAAGALQDGARDDLAAVQARAMMALYEASIDGSRPLIVQISANTAGAGADTPFMVTKRQADEALKESGLPHVILRPALVIGRNAHGGTALVRALAAFPFVTPLIHAQSGVQIVALDDVARAVVDAVDGTIANGTDLELAHDEALTLAQTVAAHRAWLGLRPARARNLPGWLGGLTGWGADLAGRFGWRSPLRSTAMAVMESGVAAGQAGQAGRALKSLDETLAGMAAGAQDLWFARLYLLKPAVFKTLALFWMASGVIALVRFDASSAYLEFAGLSAPLAAAATWITSLADIALGMGVLWRAHAAKALIGMIVVSLGYLVVASFATPGLWLDPLGPLVKVLPSIALALVALAILDER